MADKRDAAVSSQNRSGGIDLLRFIGILLMIMGHVGFGGVFAKYIHAFHMPLWFFITGIFAKTDRPFGDVLKKRVKTLLIPYLFFSIVYEILWTLLGNNRWMGLLYPNSVQIPINGAIWFLPAMFFVSMIGFCLLKYLPKYVSYPLFVLLAVLGSLNLVSLPLSLDSALVGLGFFFIGYLLKQYAEKAYHLPLWFSLPLLAVGSALVFLNGTVNMRKNEYAIIPLFWLSAVCIIPALLSLCHQVDKKVNLKICKEIGAQSIIYVCTNEFIIKAFQVVLPSSLPQPVMIVLNLFITAATIAIGFWMNRLILKTPLKFLLGK